jgi:hypothetical protein
MFAAYKPTIIKKGKEMNHLGIDVGRRKCRCNKGSAKESTWNLFSSKTILPLK